MSASGLLAPLLIMEMAMRVKHYLLRAGVACMRTSEIVLQAITGVPAQCCLPICCGMRWKS